jgi:hypothetical protein
MPGRRVGGKGNHVGGRSTGALVSMLASAVSGGPTSIVSTNSTPSELFPIVILGKDGLAMHLGRRSITGQRRGSLP